jgi:hypothetical protein
MHKRRLALRDVRPRQGILKLKLENRGRLPLIFHELEQARLDIQRNLARVALFRPPHRHPLILQPEHCFFENSDHGIGIPS